MSSPTGTGATLRYIQGDISTVTRDLDQDLYGAYSIGSDGVLRSFANNRTVIDYRQVSNNTYITPAQKIDAYPKFRQFS
jgi:hypothetical protein